MHSSECCIGKAKRDRPHLTKGDRNGWIEF